MGLWPSNSAPCSNPRVEKNAESSLDRHNPVGVGSLDIGTQGRPQARANPGLEGSIPLGLQKVVGRR